MSSSITFDYSKALTMINEDELARLQPLISHYHGQLHQKLGSGRDYLGWLDWPVTFDRAEYARLQKTAEEIRAKCDAFIIIGIGGSYLGAKAAIELLTHTFHNQLPKTKRQYPEIYFLGHQLSSTYMSHLLELLEGKELCVNVISKSGTTTEPAVAFRWIRKYMENKYGSQEASKRIYATTDSQRGALRQLASKEGYETFMIPDDIGGRYSVLTAVGLLPMAVAGIATDDVLSGAQQAYQRFKQPNLDKNPCYQYAALRHLLYQQGKLIEILVSSEPNLNAFSEWWKQLFGESEGKNNKGIFPTALTFTTDLHSLGQYIQDGHKHLFETILSVDQTPDEIIIPEDDDNIDGLNYVANQTIQHINKVAIKAASFAHADGGIPNLNISIPTLSAYYFGQLVYFFEKACALSGYLLGVNPFDQPGVEAYKQNMYALLGKPGYEQEKRLLEKRINS